MDTTFVKQYKYISKVDVIGKVGNTGNAAGKPTHLHYSIKTTFPFIWLYHSKNITAWEKLFYINPLNELNFSEKKAVLPLFSFFIFRKTTAS